MDDSTREKVVEHYQRGQGSIQDIARVYRVSVSEVLEAIGHPDLSSVTVGGDMIDQSEAGNTPVYYGEKRSIPFDVS